MDCIVHGVRKSQTRLSNFHFHFSLFMLIVHMFIFYISCKYNTLTYYERKNLGRERKTLLCLDSSMDWAINSKALALYSRI